jgi:hypothetical protein
VRASNCLRAFASAAHTGEANYPASEPRAQLRDASLFLASIFQTNAQFMHRVCFAAWAGALWNPYFAIKTRHAIILESDGINWPRVCIERVRTLSESEQLPPPLRCFVEAVIFVHTRCNGEQHTRHRKLHFVIWLKG